MEQAVNIQKRLTELEQIIATSTDAMERIKAIDEYGTWCLNNRLPLNIEWAKESLQLSQQLNYKIGIFGSATNCGYYYGIHNDFPTSQHYLFQALEVSRETGSEEDYPITLSNIANNYELMGELDTAMKYIHEAIEINERIGSKQLVRNFAILAGIYYALERFDKSMEYFRKAEVLAIAQNNQSALAMYVGNVGHCYHEMKDYGKAIDQFSKALEINQAMNIEMGIANNTGSLGHVYMDLKNYDRAVEYLEKSVELTRKIDYKTSIANHLSYLGTIYAALDNPKRDEEKAEAFLLEAEAIANAIQAKDVQQSTAERLSDFYKQTKNWEKFAEYVERAHQIEKETRTADAIKSATSYEAKKQLAVEEATRKATEKILHNILPQKIAERIKNGEEEIIERFENCSVLFADMVGFTKWSEKKNVNELGATLNHIFSMFDGLANEFGVEKIKTIGDAYMCVSGLPEPCYDHAERMAKMALGMNEKIKEAYPNGEIKLRIGIHTGEVVAGVIGKNKYAYDLWGDTVNTASRMESHGVENKIQVSDEFKNSLSQTLSEGQGLNANTGFVFEERGEIEVKGKGKMKTFFLQKKVE